MYVPHTTECVGCSKGRQPHKRTASCRGSGPGARPESWKRRGEFAPEVASPEWTQRVVEEVGFPFVMCLNVRTSARTFRLLAVGRAQSQAGRARYLSLGSGVARVYGSEMTKED